MAEAIDYPLHLGITEAGGMMSGTVKSSIGMGMLLWSGIGDTIRVSLSADPVEEVRVGFDILKSLGLRHRGVNIVSCPSCARQGFNVIETVKMLEERLKHIATPMTLSIIGCVVNGPGEARETDLGFTGGGAGKGHGMIYLNGKPAYKLGNEDWSSTSSSSARRRPPRSRPSATASKSRSKPRSSARHGRSPAMIPEAKLGPAASTRFACPDRKLETARPCRLKRMPGASGSQFVKLSTEHAELAPVIEAARAYRSTQKQIEDTEA